MHRWAAPAHIKVCRCAGRPVAFHPAHATSGATLAFRRTAWGGWPNARRNARRIRSRSAKPVSSAMTSSECRPCSIIARSVARKLVVYHRRAGGQSQFSALLELEPKSDRVQSALDYAKKHLQNTLSVEELAEAARLSPRQFSRTFRAETGQSPAKAVENLRVEAARMMMEGGRHSMDIIASETGFADRERMRRAFLRALGQPPQTVRRNSRALSS